jgi:transcriptional regulator with XRE-family HTH domain
MLNSKVNHAFLHNGQPSGMQTAETVGDRIRRQREAKGLDLAPVAKAAGITISALSQIETGVTKNPRPETLFRLADALDVEPRFLVFGHHDRVAPSLSALSLSEFQKRRIRNNNNR